MEERNRMREEAVKQKDNTVCYPEILEGMELRCRVKGMRMKEDMVLLRKEAAKSYTYLYQTEGLVPELREKEVLFFDEGQNEIFRVQAPYMRDFSGSKSARQPPVPTVHRIPVPGSVRGHKPPA